MTMLIRTLYFAACLGAACSSELDAKPPAAPPSASVSASPVAEARTFGSLWDRAETSTDDADLLRLALDEGAGALLSTLDDPKRGPVALRALAHASDRDLAIGPLASRIRTGGPGAEPAATALSAVLAAPGADRERLDPDGERAAVRDLLEVAKDAKRPAELRARAASALRRLAERGLIDPGEIPDLNR
jgi:hypothetical protein